MTDEQTAAIDFQSREPQGLSEIERREAWKQAKATVDPKVRDAFLKILEPSKGE